MSEPVTYLLHFSAPYHHARHYLGSTGNLERRLAAHRSGHGARLMEVVCGSGIDFEVARTWPGGRGTEQRIKRWKCAPRLCPICRDEALALACAGLL